MIQGLLFDFDGTLFDSNEANIVAYTAAFSEAGITFNPAKYKNVFGLRFSEMMDVVAPETDADTRQRIQDLKATYYKDSLNLVRPNTGLLSLVKSSSGKFKTALVTTARRVNVESVLQYFDVDLSIFTVIITSEDVTHGKPNPECYTIACTRLGLKPEECLTFEDSKVGVTAAVQAGTQTMKVVM